ncbi:MAG: hypothetical protein AB1626_00545 [Candidatus Micrarchaeota archaeon]
MRRSQIELSMLTRFAMIFFIVSLAALMLGLSNREKAQLCSTQASSMASSIASQITQVITSPVEDEKKIFPLSGSLAVGKDEYSRYQIIITNKPPARENASGYLLIEVRPASGGLECRTTVPVYYDEKQFETSQGDPIRLVSASADRVNETELGRALTLEPSIRGRERSWFLNMIKCRPKLVGLKTLLWIEDCNYEDPARCMNFSSLDNCCGWAWMTPEGGGSPDCTG